MASIFDKQRLKPSQLRTIAERRFADVQYLLNSKENKYANGAMYLGGFVVECLLKARLLEKYRWLGTKVDLSMLGQSERELHALCYRSHDLEKILEYLPNVLRNKPQINLRGNRVEHILAKVCGEWTIFARYSTQTADIGEAERFLANVGELKQWPL